MKCERAVREMMETFCRAWFEKRDVEEAASCLDENVEFINAVTDEDIHGKEEFSRYIQRDVKGIKSPFSVRFSGISGQAVAEGVCNLSADLTLQSRQLSCRLLVFSTLTEQDGQWKFVSMHFAEPCKTRGGRVCDAEIGDGLRGADAAGAHRRLYARRNDGGIY